MCIRIKLLAVSIALCTPLFAADEIADDEIAVGDAIIATAEDCQRYREGVVRPISVARTFRVERVDGEKIWVTSGGFLLRSDVLPFDQGAEYFDREAETSPSAQSFRNRGRMKSNLGDHAGALEDIERSLALDPQPETYHSRAVTLHRMIRVPEAIESLTQAIELDGLYARAYSLRGVLRCMQGDGLAGEDLDQAIMLDPDDEDALLMRARLASKRKEIEDAIADYQKVLLLDSENLPALRECAWCFAQKESYAEALENLNAAIDLKASARLFGMRAWVKSHMELYEDAIKDAELALKFDSNNLYAHELLNKLLLSCPLDELRDPDRAVKHAKLACELTHWSDGSVIEHLALAAAGSGDMEGAVDWSEKATEAFKKRELDAKSSELNALRFRFRVDDPKLNFKNYAKSILPEERQAEHARFVLLGTRRECQSQTCCRWSVSPVVRLDGECPYDPKMIREVVNDINQAIVKSGIQISLVDEQADTDSEEAESADSGDFAVNDFSGSVVGTGASLFEVKDGNVHVSNANPLLLGDAVHRPIRNLDAAPLASQGGPDAQAFTGPATPSSAPANLNLYPEGSGVRLNKGEITVSFRAFSGKERLFRGLGPVKKTRLTQRRLDKSFDEVGVYLPIHEDDPARQRHAVAKGLMQAMGCQWGSPLEEDSVLYESYASGGTAGALSKGDVALLRLLYEHLQSGDGRKEVDAAIRDHWSSVSK